MLGGLIGQGVNSLTMENQAQPAQPPQTLRQYYDEQEKHSRNNLVLIQRAREKADRLNLMDHPKEEVLGLIYFDAPF